MSNLTELLAKIEGLAEKATKGPWKWDDEVPMEFVREYYKERAPFLVPEGSHMPVLFGEIAARNSCDVTFIAASRELVPALVKALQHSQETAQELAIDTFSWAMRYEITQQEYFNQREQELTAILEGKEQV